MQPLADGFASEQERGFIIKQDLRDAANVTRLRQAGDADLSGLEGGNAHRDIDWLIFRKRLRGDRAADRMATLIWPHAAKGSPAAGDVTVERVDLKDEVAIGYRVRVGGRGDLIIVSDGLYRQFTDRIAGDFLYALVSTDEAGAVDYAGFVGVVEFRIAGGPGEAFPVKRDYEYVK
jgi:hypothetical protein